MNDKQELQTLPSNVHFCTYECETELAICKSCLCMTKTIHGKCGKCKAEKTI